VVLRIFKNKVIANGTKTTYLGMKKNCGGTKARVERKKDPNPCSAMPTHVAQ
jgi:hypothetical protein